MPLRTGNVPNGRVWCAVETPVEFADYLDALSTHFERGKADPNTDHEVIVLGGESLASLADTHARYFWRSAADLTA